MVQDFSRFVTYTGKLNWFAPTAEIPALAPAATIAEVLLGLALVSGFFTRASALLSGLMLLLFALAMKNCRHHLEKESIQ
jgi:uncharacterized membrane protein YphA (DoxX/SURF4 family)